MPRVFGWRNGVILAPVMKARAALCSRARAGRRGGLVLGDGGPSGFWYTGPVLMVAGDSC